MATCVCCHNEECTGRNTICDGCADAIEAEGRANYCLECSTLIPHGKMHCDKCSEEMAEGQNEPNGTTVGSLHTLPSSSAGGSNSLDNKSEAEKEMDVSLRPSLYISGNWVYPF